MSKKPWLFEKPWHDMVETRCSIKACAAMGILQFVALLRFGVFNSFERLLAGAGFILVSFISGVMFVLATEFYKYKKEN